MSKDALDKLLKHTRVGETLIHQGLITQEQLDEALQVQKQSTPRRLLGEIIVESGFCTEDGVVEALANANDIPYAKLEPALCDISTARLLQRDFMEKQRVLPLFLVDNVLTVALSEPTNLYLIEELSSMLSGQIQIVASSASDIKMMLASHVPDEKAFAIDDLMEESADVPELVERIVQEEVVDLEAEASESPVVKFVNYMIYAAVRERASDIHIEPDDAAFRVRFRIDGQLVERLTPPEHMHPAIVSRIKIMSSLDISERRLPQDGSIHVRMGGKPVDLRVSTLPTTFGEKVVMRIIDTSTVLVELEELGLASEMRERFEEVILNPYGLILVTGPTGSGKSTTLYSVLSRVSQPEVNICTVEDPIEFNLKGVNQFQVHQKIDLSFAAILRSLLRQDPDIVMIGEMRDHETAHIGIQASLTGHMVLSTLHTNDAPGAITRLFNLGIEPYLVGASLTAILAQRLVRRVCQHCRAEYEPDIGVMKRLKHLGLDDLAPFVRGRGCTRCHNSGYQGRNGIFELLIPDDEMRDMITAGATLDQLRKRTANLGMKRLFDDGIRKVRENQTTIEEILRVTLEG